MHDDAEQQDEQSAMAEFVKELGEANEYITLISEFIQGQREVLRLGNYVAEREVEIDDPRSRAIKAAQRLYPGIPIEVVEPLWAGTEQLIQRMKSNTAPDTEERNAITDGLAGLFNEIPSGYGSELPAAMFESILRPPDSPRLFSSLLTALIGDFEVMIAGLARAMISKHPEVLASPNVKFGWLDVAAFDNLEDFRQDVIERTVDELLFGSFNDWMDFFKLKCHVDVPALAAGYDLQEVFQRRHVIVHNGAKVSRQYVEKLQPYGPTPEIGTALDVDLAYLSRAADVLCVLGVTLIVNSAMHFLKEQNEHAAIERVVGNFPYQLLRDGRYECAYLISCEQDTSKFVDTYRALVVQVNRWLAQKRMGQLEACRAEIENWQTDVLQPQFQLAKLALLDDLPAAYAIVQEIRGTTNLSYDFWWSWPLLEELRTYEAALLVKGESDSVVDGVIT